MSHLPRRSLLLGAVATASTLLLAACGSASPSASSGDSSGSNGSNGSNAAVVSTPPNNSPYKGVYLDRTFNKPAVTLTDTTGKPYDLIQRTAGKAVLLYFGYTHCPDVCPTTMGDIAVAVSKLPKAQQQQLQVVFVTTDPARDTPAQLRTWLNSFNTDFVGLTGDIKTIIAAAASVGVAVEAPVQGQEPVHGAQVLAYLPSDNKAHVLYTSGTSPADFAHDLPLLIKSVTA